VLRFLLPYLRKKQDCAFNLPSIIVIAGLVPATHDLSAARVFVGGRDKPGDDGEGI
jgi:hypothetical protein